MRQALAINGFVLALGVVGCAGGTSGLEQSGSNTDQHASPAPAKPAGDWVRVIGTLAATAATVGDSIRAGEVLEITVHTIGTSSCIGNAGTEVTVEHHLARVVAYDSVPAPESGIACATVMTGVRHDATVRFESSGNATVRVVGYQGYGAERRLDSLDYRVLVAP